MTQFDASWLSRHVDAQLKHPRGLPRFWNWEVTAALLVLELADIA